MSDHANWDTFRPLGASAIGRIFTMSLATYGLDVLFWKTKGGGHGQLDSQNNQCIIVRGSISYRLERGCAMPSLKHSWNYCMR